MRDMGRSPFLLAFAICIPAVMPFAASAAVAINEILFDPAGADTGLEKIELYNPDAAAQDLSGWELYPDGIGYFSFPDGFLLSSASFVTIHFRASGANDAENLYHSSPTANMGNSSGSLALFRPGGRGAGTIVDFVRYYKPGSSERKTWEPAAIEAGLWVAGEFVDVGALTEGSSIGLAHDGARSGAAAWAIFQAPTIGAGNSSTPAPPPSGTPPPASATSTPTADSGRTPPPSLRVEAGADRAALAGATVEFHGQVFGLDGSLVPEARMVWNFGDGETREGKAVPHVYRFPGNYVVSLSGSVGEYAGADYLAVRVVSPDLRITEIKPGSDGFIEIANNTGERLDLGGMILADASRAQFRIPQHTLTVGGGAIVFPNSVTGLLPFSPLEFRDAAGRQIDAAAFSGAIPDGGSWERWDGGFRMAQTPTPGSAKVRGVSDRAPVQAEAASPSPAGPPAEGIGSFSPANGSRGEVLAGEPFPVVPAATAASRVESRPLSAAAWFSVSGRTLFAASVLLGLAAAIGIVLVKRALP